MAWTLARRALAPRCFARSAHFVSLIDTAHPGDTSALLRWLDDNKAARPRCVLGKTEGNGCVNDFTRGYASHVVDQALGNRKSDASIIMSGGTEGVLTPHLLVFATDDEHVQPAPPEHEERLTIGVARSREIAPHEIGRTAQVLATHEAVLAACGDAGLAPSDAAFVQIKCPLLTPERVNASAEPCTTSDSYYSMALSRGASSIGVALATGELTAPAQGDSLDALLAAQDFRSFSAVASASAGVELMHAEVLVLGNRKGASSALRAAHCTMDDAIDAPSVYRMLAAHGLPVEHGQLAPEARRRVKAVLAKADPAPTVRGERTTMCSDSDLNATRHSRAAVGGLLGGIFGTTRLYVSGGAEHQGPAGGGPVCVLYEA